MVGASYASQCSQSIVNTVFAAAAAGMQMCQARTILTRMVLQSWTGIAHFAKDKYALAQQLYCCPDQSARLDTIAVAFPHSLLSP